MMQQQPQPQQQQARALRRQPSSNLSTMRYMWLIVTGCVFGFSTFVIYDRMYHSVEVSQLLVLSVDTMNVVQQQGQQQHASGSNSNDVPNDSKTTTRTLVEAKTTKNNNLQSIVEEAKQVAKEANEVVKQEVIKQQDRQKQETEAEDAANANAVAGDDDDSEDEEEKQKQADLQAMRRKKRKEKEAAKVFKTTGPKEPIQVVKPTDVVRNLDDVEGDERYRVYFLNQTQVTHKDSFSASWLQSKQDFMNMRLEIVQICEDAAFKAWSERKDKLRMTMDYFDWSVEHLSKWWKLLDMEREIVYDSVTTKLQSYIQAGDTDYPNPAANNNKQQPVLSETISVIAFQPYKMKGKPAKIEINNERAYNLTVISLAATLESLRRGEMGRVVVVGSDGSHEKYTKDAIAYLRNNLKVDPVPVMAAKGGREDNNKTSLIGHLEVAHVLATPDMTRTKHLARNMPKGALVGARRGFELADKSPKDRTDEDNQFLAEWFGTNHDPSHWKYLYLTEPDSILTTRSSALPQIKEEIDIRGGIISPFRLQPIPHESDIRGYQRQDRFLHESDGFETVLELDHYADSHDVCCDEHMGHDHRPGKMPGDECGHKKWFLCGFEEKVKTPDPHRRLRPYQLFRLTKGTGLTTIAGNLFGRRCFAGQGAVCRPPFVH